MLSYIPGKTYVNKCIVLGEQDNLEVHPRNERASHRNVHRCSLSS